MFLPENSLYTIASASASDIVGAADGLGSAVAGASVEGGSVAGVSEVWGASDGSVVNSTFWTTSVSAADIDIGAVLKSTVSDKSRLKILFLFICV